MRHIVFAIIAVANGLVALGVQESRVPLRLRAVSTTGVVGAGVIAGRARCGASTWLLTDLPTLIEVRLGDRSIVSKSVRGLGANERAWGLACVGAGELWTLVDYRSLARLSPSGQVVSRTQLREQRLNVFGVANVLLLQQPPVAPGSPLLSAVRAVDVNRSDPWPGPTTTAQSSPKVDVSSALVACGVSYEAWLPCWIANQARIIVSDGTRAHTSAVHPQFVATTAVDPRAPLWDVALSSPSSLWILTSAVSGEGGRRVGGRITRSNLRGEDLGGVDVTPRARVIVRAGEQSAVVLTVSGSLVEVTAP